MENLDLQLVKIGDLYCMQASVGAKELSSAASIFYGASQEEILEMTKRTPLDCFSASVFDERHLFLDNGTHRAYLIRFHSAKPSDDVELWTKIWPNVPYKKEILEKVVKESRAVDKLKYRR